MYVRTNKHTDKQTRLKASTSLRCATPVGKYIPALVVWVCKKHSTESMFCIVSHNLSLDHSCSARWKRFRTFEENSRFLTVFILWTIFSFSDFPYFSFLERTKVYFLTRKSFVSSVASERIVDTDRISEAFRAWSKRIRNYSTTRNVGQCPTWWPPCRI